jgi:hypothetical protein
MGKPQQANGPRTLVAPGVITPLAALLLVRSQPSWRSRAWAAVARTVQLLVMALALAALVAIAVIGYTMVR